MKINQKGALDLMLIITIVLVAAIGGFLIYRLVNEDVIDNSSSQSLIEESQVNDTINQEELDSAELPADETVYQFKNAPISFSYDQNWQLLEDGINFGLESGRCGQSVVSEEITCIDYAMLAPADEEFTNTDQFRVNIGVFAKTDELSAREWDEQKVFQGQDGLLSDAQFPEIDMFDVVRTESDYSTEESKEIRVRYVLTSGAYGIVFFSNMFEGDNYSYTGDKDYTALEPEIDKIANSFTVMADN